MNKTVNLERYSQQNFTSKHVFVSFSWILLGYFYILSVPQLHRYVPFLNKKRGKKSRQKQEVLQEHKPPSRQFTPWTVFTFKARVFYFLYIHFVFFGLLKRTWEVCDAVKLNAKCSFLLLALLNPIWINLTQFWVKLINFLFTFVVHL